MKNYNQLAQEYHKRFPEIPEEVHLRIIRGGIGGENPAMSEEGFRKWYDFVGGKLINHQDILNELIREPHFILYREAMILGDDWWATPILRLVA